MLKRILRQAGQLAQFVPELSTPSVRPYFETGKIFVRRPGPGPVLGPPPGADCVQLASSFERSFGRPLVRPRCAPNAGVSITKLG
jgi:hypothetical protein